MKRATLRPVLASAAVAVLSLAGVALTATPAAAAAIIVDTLGDADPAIGTTLREAIVAANATPAEDDVIYFSNTLLNSTILLDPLKGTLLVTDELVISGPSYTQLTVSRASGAFDIFSVQMAQADQDFALGGLTVQGAAASGRGLVVNGPSQPANYATKDVSIDYAAFRGLNSTGIGGGAAIVSITGNLTVNGSVFTGGTGDDGGAIGVSGVGGNITVVDSEFGSNTSTDDGGAISTDGVTGTITVTNTTFDENTASAAGGAIQVDGGTAVTVTGGTFTNNDADQGGAVVVTDIADLVVVQEGTSFEANSALNGSGGALRVLGTTDSVQLNGISLTRNDATDSGGAVYLQGPYTATLTAVTANGNVAASGGALYVNIFNTSVLVQDSILTNNEATDGNGGAINIQSIDPEDSFTVLRTTLAGNSADAENPVGGAIAFGTNNGTVKVDSSTFHDNSITADAGNGVSIGASQFNNEVVDIVNSTFEETEPTEAYAIFFPGNTGTVLVRSVTLNALGGLHFDQNSGTVRVLNTISDVSASGDSVFVEVGGDPAEALHSIFSDAFDSDYIASAATNRFSIPDMRLGPLQNNGGPTDTRVPAANSPAVGNGSALADAMLPVTDQRGPGFPRVLGALDIGAVEIPQPLANTGSTGLPVWVPIVGGIVLLAGIGFVVFAVVTRRKTVTGASEGDVNGLGEPGPGTGGDSVFPEASSAPPTAQPPAENDPR